LEGYDSYEERFMIDEDNPSRVLPYKLHSKYGFLELNTVKTPPGAVISIDGEEVERLLSSTVKLAPGRHVVKVVCPGYEDYVKDFFVGRDETRKLDIPALSPRTKLKAFIRSFFLPGNGQMYLGHTTKGAFIFLLQVAAISGAVYSKVDYERALEDYEKARDYYRGITSSMGEIERARNDAEKKYESARNAYYIREASVALIGVVYAVNLMDVLRTTPKFELSVRGNVMDIRPRVRLSGDYTGISLSMNF